MKKIGFIDYFIDEWHANNYPQWVRDARHGGRYDVAWAWAAMEKPGKLTTAEWCAKFGVKQAATQEQLIDQCDCIVVLSPDNPEQHESLARLALSSGKPVYVDKTFSTSLAEAVRMFELADKQGTPMYTTSALRNAQELSWLKETGLSQQDIQYAATKGPGVFCNYSIHQIEMIMAAMGAGARRAIAPGCSAVPSVNYQFSGGRDCSVTHLPWSGFAITLQGPQEQGVSLEIEQDFWGGFVDDMLSFFDSGRSPVPRVETLNAMAMIEAGLQALAHPGSWVDVPTV